MSNVIKFAANISLLFREYPLTDRFAAARDAGFSGVEIHFPYDVPADRLSAAADVAGIEIIQINSSIAAAQGMPGIACRPGLQSAFDQSLSQAREYALQLGVQRINILAGVSMPDERVECLATLYRRLVQAGQYFDQDDVSISLESLNVMDNPGYLLSTPAEVANVLETIQCRNIGMLFDIYHTAMMGLNPVTEFHKYSQLIHHIQFADVPGRHEPGSGSLEFQQIFQVISDSGYNGWLAAEYNPVNDTNVSLSWLN